MSPNARAETAFATFEAAMAQIIEKRYDAQLRENERRTILAYGIAFCRKECRIVGKRLTA